MYSPVLKIDRLKLQLTQGIVLMEGDHVVGVPMLEEVAARRPRG